jgi:hypothetical protein
MRAIVALLVVVVLALAGCSRTKEDLVRKAESVKTRAELESRLGRPDDIAKLGPVERWTYRATNGEVVFVIVGDTVTLQAAGGGERKP